jgi:hypothetical protein
MLKHRLVMLLSAAAIAVTSGLTVASPAHADNAIVQLMNAESGQCLQPAGGSFGLELYFCSGYASQIFYRPIG